MRIRVLGLGWYGAHIGSALVDAGHDVEIHEIADRAFSGASGANPARLHLGPHYPRSGATIAACLAHQEEFMRHYGFLTRAIPINIYAIAEQDSLVDYQSYINTLKGRVELVQINPAEFDLKHCEGAILTGERHIVIAKAREYFSERLKDNVKYLRPCELIDDPAWDMTIDCTFCANDAEAIDRFEPCVTAILRGPTDKAVTIMDGPFGSIYPWDEAEGLLSLTHAALTPITKNCRTYAEAKRTLERQHYTDFTQRCEAMLNAVSAYWPEARERYKIVSFKTAIRAMPRSGADSRLVDVVEIGDHALRVRAGKIDAVFHAERLIKARLNHTIHSDLLRVEFA